jgi:hypothetical protein
MVSGTVLWSENFEGFNTTDALPDQDATWSVVNNGANAAYCLVDNTGAWPSEDNTRCFGGSFSTGSAYKSVTVTKDLSINATDNIGFEFTMYQGYLYGDYNSVIYDFISRWRRIKKVERKKNATGTRQKARFAATFTERLHQGRRGDKR